MLHTTFARTKEAGACVDSYRKMAKALGGISKYGKDTQIGLDKILEVCGFQDTIWSMRCTIEPSKNIMLEFACLCAEHVLHFFEDKHPNDKRPRKAIEATRIYIIDKSQAAWDAAWAARDAAWAAAWAAWAAAGAAAWAASWAGWAAAWDAGATWAAWAAARDAGDAAWAAARDAGATEREWQTQRLKELIG